MSIVEFKQQTGPHFYTKVVSPAEAEEMLKLNVKNRRIRDRRVTRYARDMAAGKWKNNGDVIRISWDGFLIDGQHRLSAVVESGVSVVLNFVDGLDPSSFDTIDTGGPRPPSDVLGMSGVKNATKIVSVAKKLIQWENISDKTQFTFNDVGWNLITNMEQLEYVEKHEDELQFAFSSVNGSFPYRKCGSPTALVAALVICLRYDSRATLEFIEKLKTGTSLDKNSPVAILRDRLVDPPERRGTAWNLEIMALVFKTFNYYLRGKPMKQLRWRQDGDAPEKFPVPGRWW